MVTNYIKTSIRKFRRTKTHTLINLIGLTLGFLGAIIIFQKVRYEYSFDTYHDDVDRIYRVVREDSQFGQTEYDEGVPYPLVDAFRLDFPEVPAVTIVDRNFSDPVIGIEQTDGTVERFKAETGLAFVERDFFNIFNYKWLAGDQSTALTTPRSVVLSASLAEKFFGSTNPIGRTLNIDNRYDLTVVGLVEDAPSNTVLPLNMMISFNLGEAYKRGNTNWGSTSSSTQCYIKLPEGMPASEIDRQLKDFLTRHRSAEVAEYLQYFLQPFTEIHYDERFGEIGNHSIITKETLWALALIGLILLITACINFINLNTVLVFRRAREIGVRKVMGSTPRHIVAYFMTETVLLTLIALSLAFVLVQPIMEASRSFIGEGYAANPFDDPLLGGAALLTALVLSLCSGLYPALLLARLHPTVAIRNATGFKPGSFMSLRRGLVVFQFAISQVLIICTLVAVYQMRYLNDVPLGYDTEAIVEFDIPERDQDRLETLRNELLQTAAVRDVTYSNSGASSGNTWGSNFYYIKGEDRLENETQVKFVDQHYIDTYGMELIAGDLFTPSDTVSGFIANEAFVRIMGYTSAQEALGTLVETWGYENIPIVGVIRDFNTNSLHKQIEPTLLIPTLRNAYVGAVKVQTDQLGPALSAIESAWSQAYPNYIFEHTFLDEKIERFYEEEQTMQQLIQAFALVAILIGCIGLFGLISFTTSQRAREVGIRKVLGASVGHVVTLFTREFAVMVVLGFIVSGPVAYYVMDQWLSNFAYRIDISIGLFMTAFLISLVIALGTVGFKTFQAAIANPVDAIRAE